MFSFPISYDILNMYHVSVFVSTVPWHCSAQKPKAAMLWVLEQKSYPWWRNTEQLLANLVVYLIVGKRETLCLLNNLITSVTVTVYCAFSFSTQVPVSTAPTQSPLFIVNYPFLSCQNWALVYSQFYKWWL